MSMLDRKNGKISMLKYWLSIVVASFLGIGAYLVTHIKELSDWLVCVGCLSLAGLFTAIIILNKRINKHIDDLKDL